MPKTTVPLLKEGFDYFHNNPFNGMNDNITSLIEPKKEAEMTPERFAELAAIPLQEDETLNNFASDLNRQLNEAVEENLKNSLINWSYGILWKINKMEADRQRSAEILKSVKSFLLMLTQIRDTKDFHEKILNFIGEPDDGASNTESGNDGSGLRENQTNE